MLKAAQKLLKNNKNLTFLVLVTLIAIIFRNNTFSDWLLVLATIVGLIAPLEHIVRTIRTGHFPPTLTLPLIAITALLVQDFWTAIIVTISASLLQRLSGMILAENNHVRLTMPTRVLVTKGKATITVPLKQINPGMVIIIAPGEIIPVDGEVVSGETRVQDTLLTGEPTLLPKSLGSRVYAGSINQDQTISVKVTHTAQHSQYSLTRSMHKSARATTSDLLQSSSIITVLVIVISFISAALTYQITKETSLALVILVLANPLSILLSAKLALYGGLNRAARKGIHFKSLRALENTAATREIFLDLHSTLDSNSYRVSTFTAKNEPKTRVMSIARSMASSSKNSRIQAISRYTKDADLAKDVSMIKHHKNELITARLKNDTLMIGGSAVLIEKGINDATDPEKLYVIRNNEVIGIFTLRLSVNTSDQNTASHLMQLVSNNVSVFSEESERISRQPVATLQIENLYADCTDADKIQVMQSSLKTPTLYLTSNPQDPSLKAATISACTYPTGLTADIPKTDIVILGARTNILPDAILIAKQSIRQLLVFTSTAVLIALLGSLLVTLFMPNPIYAIGIYLVETFLFLWILRILSYKR